MKRLVTFIILFTVVICFAGAQDVVYLNNGTVVEGKVLQQGSLVVLVNNQGDTLDYPQARVREVRLHSHEVLPKKSHRKEYVHYSDFQSGFWMTANLAFGYGNAWRNLNNEMHAFHPCVDIVGGYRFSQFFKVGIGVSPGAIISNSRYVYDKFSLPVYFHVRGNFIDDEPRMFSPIWGMDLGCDFPQENTLYLAPMLGIRWGEPRNALIVSVSYSIQQVRLETPFSMEEMDPIDSPSGFYSWYGKVSIKIGYEF